MFATISDAPSCSPGATAIGTAALPRVPEYACVKVFLPLFPFDGVPLLTVYRLERSLSVAPQIEDEVRPRILLARDLDPEAPLRAPVGDRDRERLPSTLPGRLAVEHGPPIDEDLHAHGRGHAVFHRLCDGEIGDAEVAAQS